MQGPKVREVSPVGTKNSRYSVHGWKGFVEEVFLGFEWKGEGVMDNEIGENEKDEMTSRERGEVGPWEVTDLEKWGWRKRRGNLL